MRPSAARVILALAATAFFAGTASAQVTTRLYDHVHMSVPEPLVAAQWYHDHIGGEWVDGRTDRLLFGTTRIMFLGNRGNTRTPSAEGSIAHLGFSYTDIAAKVDEAEVKSGKHRPRIIRLDEHNQPIPMKSRQPALEPAAGAS